MRLSTFISVCLLWLPFVAFAGGIRGTVKSDEGSVLAFATIFVKQTGTGTTTNENGLYEITLPAGSYQLVYQYLGYESVVKQIEVGSGFTEVNIELKTQVVVLKDVIVRAGKEDPAYTIMRKAISKAKYHTQAIDRYSARVYIKGAGQLKDYPWLAKKTLEKEGITKDRVYISESVSDISYTRPNTFDEKVISIRSDGKDNNTSPNPFIFGSFYQPEVAETVSPLSPKAFAYYRFQLMGTFKDREFEINRIKVTPRSRGDNVVEGIIYIVDDWWSIHSLDVKTTKMGVNIGIKMLYAPIEDKAWLPISNKFDIQGKFFGFEFVYNYLATISDYQITMNPELYVEEMQVVDEKLDKEQAKEIEEKYGEKNQQLQERMASGKEISRKELRGMLKDYEKQERKQQSAPEVVSNNTYKIDSLAYKKNNTYWDSIRPVPLTKAEVKGYQIADSIAVVEKKKEEGDTLKQSKHKGFQPWDIILGDSYKISKHSNFRIHTPLGGFNTVEGFNIIYRLSLGTVIQDTNKTRFSVSPTLRYAFSREKLTGLLTTRLYNKNYRLELQGGRYVKQYNQEEPIWPLVNTFTTLLLEQNLMKLYERDFVNLLYRQKLSNKISFHTNWALMKRRELFNTSSFKLIDRKKIEDYTPNAPFNEEIDNTSFPEHEAFIGSAGLVIRPWIKYRIRNGNKQEIPFSSPVFTLDYRKGFNQVFGSDVNFDQVEAGIKHRFDVGVRGTVDFAFQGGMFLNKDKLYFMDFKHFLGNRTPFATSDPVGSFRLLDYYQFSTSDKYFTANVHYHFRKFLVTAFPIIRMTGIRENVFVNYLASPTSNNYTEIGYSIDGILRIFRLEAAASFQNGKYQDYGFRIGIATSIGINFSED
ncbi:DUF5686 and carboxypeptidase regulatory-like domain-containing protein [Rhodocytophaga aerolata]|uniref:DUF5686 and carboxypeptidase regulatory-like domain-containing protein n=1 Tax=Rhodocytophaga aerolata TaxID=455078 RepID=A0ABT8RD39_9BACT|nr:DUF5686 and carboxypeptidase regulatory-like domain-containing protein [Rhodocytophaga aerolata]MDO1448662.1 DUF5686 and carboxypeptidase regulatory-like domain-containing protein [Rhodocytophaga aerolata]